MTLNEFAAEKRLVILEDLKDGLTPREGEFDEVALADAKVKGQPQLGATRYEPNAIFVEYIYPEQGGSTAVISVKLTPPERIVFMPVPKWVVESIWQGEISGSYHFESEALRLLEEFQGELTPERNATTFARRMPVGRA